MRESDPRAVAVAESLLANAPPEDDAREAKTLDVDVARAREVDGARASHNPSPVPERGELRRKRPVAGAQIGHYELIRPLGRGGMGEVFLARDMRLGRRVALKFLRIVDEQQRSRFDVEARATARLTHENIVAIYDVADHDGVPYMVLEYVPGKTLAAWLRERMEDGDEAGRAAVPGAEGTPRARVPESRAAEMLLPVVRALECAHAAGIVHRDLKPANIMLTDSGTVKVLDFGVAKLINVASGDSGAPGQRGALEAERPAKVDVTAGGAVVGTLAFMAPEQWSMEGVDGRADLWAIGILLFQLVAGEHPLAPISNVALASVPILDEPMPSVRARRTSVGSVR